MINFPSSPSVGQKYPTTAGLPSYTWDGVKWTGGDLYTAPPSSTLPLMDNVIAAPGSANTYARGDHRHPFDTLYAPVNNATFTGTLTASTFNISGNITVGGVVTTAADGNQFGNAGPETWDATSPANCNIVFYDYTGGNWAGIGADVNGFFYIRTGAAGSNAVSAMIADTAKAGFTGNVYAPTPATSNDTRVATTAYVAANQALGGPYLPLSGGTITGTLTVNYGHIMPYRNGATGVCYFGNGDRYLYYDGTNYIWGTGVLNTAAGRVWGTSDFSAPVINARIGGHAGDLAILNTAALQESYAGAVHTGASGANFIVSPPSGTGYTQRYRYNQVYTTSWFSAGYA